MGINKYILMLSVTFLYTGLVLTFWSGVYGSSVGFTKDFGGEAKSLVGFTRFNVPYIEVLKCSSIIIEKKPS
jgi:hypothetical protein